MVEKGTYTIDKQKSIIKSTTTRNNATVKTEMHYIIRGKELHIESLSGDEATGPAVNRVYEKVE